MSTMNYRGYSARVEYDDSDGIFFGRIAGISDVVGFHADNVADLKAAFHEAVDDYVETCARIGKAPLKPYSGNVMFRIDPATHRAIAVAADLAGESLNQWAEHLFRSATSSGDPEAEVAGSPRKATRKDVVAGG